MRITEETIDKMNVYNLRNVLLDRGITAANYQRADLMDLSARGAWVLRGEI